MSSLLSFVIPCYRSEKTIDKVMDEIIKVVGERPEYDYEIITVNDCSPDNVYSVLVKRAEQNPNIKVINFAKNMGKHAAVLAGYSVAKGDYIVNLDDDYQCPTYELWKLLDPVAANECDCATAKYYRKKESLFKRMGSKVNHWMSTVLLEKPKHLAFENFSVMKAFVAKEIINYKNPYPYLEGLIFRTTNKVKAIEMDERERFDDGASGFTFRKSLSLLSNGLTAFSVKPLRIASFIGVIFSIFGFAYGAFTVINKLVNPNIQVGYSSMLAVILFSSGLMMLMLGIIGEYLGRIYICINNSPQYVIRDTINIDKQ